MSARNPPVPAASAMRPPTGPVAAGKLHTMKEVCEECGMTYETLKFYCNRGLVPNVKRDANNRRVFDDRDVAWLKSLSCLKRCNMSISDMQHYLDLCVRGKATIPERKAFLAASMPSSSARWSRFRRRLTTSIGNRNSTTTFSRARRSTSPTMHRRASGSTSPCGVRRGKGGRVKPLRTPSLRI